MGAGRLLIGVTAAVWILGALFGAAFGAPGATAGAAAVAGAHPATDPGTAALADAGCVLCHAVPEAAAPPRTESCAGCHAWIRGVSASPAARARALAAFPAWERYERNVHSYLAVPDLGAAAARLTPGWVEEYLADPYDLRPGLSETMVRTHLSPEAAAAVSGWFTARVVAVPPTPAPSPENLERGATLFAERGCAACHTFGGRSAGPGIPSAPDLRHARDRLSPDMAAAWIRDPRALSPSATMPALGLSSDEAVAVRDFLFLADPGGVRATAATAPRLPTDGPPPTTPTWDVVNERVFARICAHCHMDPAQNEGRAGPGNAGGFGFAATGLELQTWEGVRAAEARILAALDRKEAEAARDAVAPGQIPDPGPRPERPGMPLGLPALATEDLALVRAWFAAGAPR